ncbi:MAG TPA: hypothetical protein VIX13_05110, partial [Candidatus Eisenbacteria bacterium]
LLPTGAGENVILPTGGIYVQHAVWMPDGRSLCLAGTESGRRIRLYRYDLDQHVATPFTEEGVGRTVAGVSPDGRFVIAGAPTAGFALYPVAGGAPRPLKMLDQSERPVGWTADGSGLWVMQRGRIPAPVFRLDPETGQRELWKEITPRTRSGVDGLNNICISPDGETYATSYSQLLAELYTVRGLG